MKQYDIFTGLRSAVGKVSGCRYVFDCRSMGRELDPGLVPYMHIIEIDHEIISMVSLLPLSDSERVDVSYKRKYCMKYWLTA